jgi:hypothetical protein
MFFRRLRDLLDDAVEFVRDNKAMVTAIIASLLIVIIFVFNLKNYYCSMLFYPDKSKTGLLYERRYVLYGKNKLDRINKVVEELLLGPINPDLTDIFPIKSKLLSSRLDKGVLSLNLSRETVMDVNWENNKNISIYKLLIQSIVDTVCYHDRSIKKIRFFFDGKEYKFIGDFNQPDSGFKPDWEMLKT